jgi:uncharacterized membrane protein
MSHHESVAQGAHGRMVDRMLFFSDAVFAIILTLLALELRPPETPIADQGELFRAIMENSHHLVAFALSFAIIGIFWSAHMRITRDLKEFDWPVAAANLGFLFTIALLPYATALVASQGWLSVGFRVYAGVIIAASLAQMVLLAAESRSGGRVLGGMSGQERVFRLLRSGAPGFAFGIGLAFSLLGQPLWATQCWILIPIIMIAANVVRPKHYIAEAAK